MTTLSAQDLSAIRERAERATPNEDYTQRVQWAFADRLSLLAYVSDLTALLGEAGTLLARAADELNVSPKLRAMDLGYEITQFRQARAAAAKMPAEREG